MTKFIKQQQMFVHKKAIEFFRQINSIYFIKRPEGEKFFIAKSFSMPNQCAGFTDIFVWFHEKKKDFDIFNHSY